MSVTVGLDVGGTKVAAGLITPDGTILCRRERPNPGRDPGLAVTREVAASLTATAAERGLPVTGLGVGFPEYVDITGQLTSRLVLDWDVQPAVLLAGLAGHITVESDVRCGAIAEARLCSGRRLSSFVYVSIGTGISYCHVLDGEPVRGARGEAIALGELPAPEGTLEQFASGEAIRARYAAAVPASARGPSSAREVLAAADRGDPLAADVVRTAAAAIAAALGWLTCLLDPAAVILGGGLGHAGGLWGHVLSDYSEQAVATRPSPPPVLRGALGPDAGLIGAGLIASLPGTRG